MRKVEILWDEGGRSKFYFYNKIEKTKENLMFNLKEKCCKGLDPFDKSIFFCGTRLDLFTSAL